MSQNDIPDEIIVDNFAGGGGASTGMELAAGRPVAIAINHDPAAILLHRTNHPYTEHLQASVWDVDPVAVCRGRPVGLAWFSPDCKHFSKAKGKALLDRNIRGLAWIVLRWAALVRPRVIMLENVEEFQTWGPVRKGKPVKQKAGQTFRKWKQQLSDLGYAIEHRELVAADFGAPTTRKRFCLVARCDGQPIVWPEPTHAPRDSEEVRAGKRKPWRSAAEIIDWSVPGYSIFATKQEIWDTFGVKAVRPLAPNTMRRIIRGVDKFTIRSGKPFVVECGKAANLIQYHTEQSEKVRGQGMEEPIMTVDSSNRYGLTCANLVEYYTGGRPLDVDTPLHTVTSHDREALVSAHVVKFKGQEIGTSPAEPLPTACAKSGSGGFARCCAVLVKADGRGLGHWPKIRELLNEHCGYSLAWDDLILLLVGGVWCFIADITLRMLTPRELYNAMGFPADYIIDHDWTGREYKKSDQVARCGNAVCPPLAEALVRANFPEWNRGRIGSMRELHEAVAAWGERSNGK